MMNQYLSLGENDKVDGMFWFEELPEEITLGPIIVTNPAVTHGRENCVINPAPFSEYPVEGWPAGPTPTSALYWTGSGTNWVETSPETFAQRKQKAINNCFVDVDAVTRAAVGDRAMEYAEAESAARAFKASGYVETEGAPVDEMISSYAKFNPTGQIQTNRWAADVIIARANAFKTAQKAMRSQRFRLQAEMQSAIDDDELVIAVHLWNEFIEGLRAQLGV